MNTKEGVKHTPGPWKVGKDGALDVYSTVLGRDNNDGYVCVIHDNAHSDANARLIAAAPDLLAALRRAEFELGEISADYSKGSALYEIRAAILRAEGGK